MVIRNERLIRDIMPEMEQNLALTEPGIMTTPVEYGKIITISFQVSNSNKFTVAVTKRYATVNVHFMIRESYE